MIFCSKKKLDYFPIGTQVLYTFRDGEKRNKKPNKYGEYEYTYKVKEQRVHKIAGVAKNTYGSYLYKICDKWYSSCDISLIIQ